MTRFAIPAHQLEKMPDPDTLFVWWDTGNKITARASHILEPTASGTGRYSAAKSNGDWVFNFPFGASISKGTNRWTDTTPAPIDWVRVGEERRPANWPARFPLLDSPKETEVAWTSRVKKSGMAGLDKLSADDYKAIYADRKQATEAAADAAANKAALQQSMQEASVKRAMAHALGFSTSV